MSEVHLTNHATYRLMERGIDVHEAKKIAKNGIVTKTQSDGTIVKSGKSSKGKDIHVVCIKEGSKIVIKTAYYEN